MHTRKMRRLQHVSYSQLSVPVYADISATVFLQVLQGGNNMEIPSLYECIAAI